MSHVVDVVRHAWRVGSVKPAILAVLELAAIGPLRKFWLNSLPWHAGKIVERRGNAVMIDGCRIDVSSPAFSTFQRGCLWLHRHEEPERLAVSRFLDRALPVVELGASTGMLSCLINRRLQDPSAHIAVEASRDMLPVLAANKALNRCSFAIVSAAVAYGPESIGFGSDDDHLAGHVRVAAKRPCEVETVTLKGLLDRFHFSTATLVCDIEGMEVDLCRHEAATLASRVPWLIVELHDGLIGQSEAARVIRELTALGFGLVWERSWTRVFRNVRLAAPAASTIA